MAQIDERGTTPAMAAAPALKAGDKSRRFTPLRSHAIRARALGRDEQSDQRLSPLVPIARQQG